MDSNFTYFDVHTHKKYREIDVKFVRNAYHHLAKHQLQKLPYYYSIGLHPWDVNLHYKQYINFFKQNLSLSNCLAIGECGLDYHIRTDIEIQKEAFLLQYNLAHDLNKPLIIHCVKAYHDLIPMIRNTRVPIVLHQFTGNNEIVKALNNPNIYFSFGRQLFTKTYNIETFQGINIEQILFETDNSNLHIEEVYLRAASFLDLEFNSVIELVNNNVNRVFNNL